MKGVGEPAPEPLAELGFSAEEAERVLRLGRECADRGDWTQAQEAVRRAREADITRSCALEIQLLALRVAIATGNPAGARAELDALCDAGDPGDRAWVRRAVRVMESTPGIAPQARSRLLERLRLLIPLPLLEATLPQPTVVRLPSVIESDEPRKSWSFPAPATAPAAAPPPVSDSDASPVWQALQAEAELAPMHADPLPWFDEEEDSGEAEEPSLLRAEESPSPAATDAAAESAGLEVSADPFHPPVLDVDPFEDPAAYLQFPGMPEDTAALGPGTLPHGWAEPGPGSRGSTGADPRTSRPCAAPRYTAAAEIRRQRGDADRTDAQALLRRFVREQIGTARAAAGPLPREEAESLFDLGTTFLQMEQYQSARLVFDQAMQHPAFQVPASEGLLEALVLGEQVDGALIIGRLALQAFASGDASLVGVRYWMGRAAELQESPSTARELYRAVLDEEPCYLDAQDRLSRLGRNA